MSEIRTFGWLSPSTKHLKTEQNGSSFRRCLKSEVFGNGTTLKSAEIRTFEFQTSTVVRKILSKQLCYRIPQKLKAPIQRQTAAVCDTRNVCGNLTTRQKSRGRKHWAGESTSCNSQTVMTHHILSIRYLIFHYNFT